VADVVVMLPEGTIGLTSKPCDTRVAGVISKRPGFVVNTQVLASAKKVLPLALVGEVFVKCTTENGPIQVGDLLVTSSKPGYAMKAPPDAPRGSVFAKAWGKLERGEGIIRALINVATG